MKRYNSSQRFDSLQSWARPFAVAAAAGLMTSMIGLPQAHGELVYEDSCRRRFGTTRRGLQSCR